MLSFLPPTPSEMMETIRTKFRTRRKTLGYTQHELATRSGVSLGSLKRFERTGQISLESLLKLAVVLECLEGVGEWCEEREEMPRSISDLIDKEK